MEIEAKEIADRLEAMATRLEEALQQIESKPGMLAGQLEHVSATIDQNQREVELASKLAAAEKEIAELKASSAASSLNPLRRTVPASTTEMLAKHGIGEGPVDVRALDAALAGLSLEQRIAVKSQLLRAGAIA